MDDLGLQYEVSWAGKWKVRTQIRNPGKSAIWLLRWGTPFEAAWLAPWAQVWLDDQELPYLGASAKRVDPSASEYLRLGAGQTRSKTSDLSQAFALGPPGSYRLRTQWQWHDALRGPRDKPPRPREQHQALAVPALTLSLLRS